MTTDAFWKIIETARQDDPDPDAVAAAVSTTLEGYSLDEILEFDRELSQRWVESYRWDLWAVAYIVNGGCSDDGFAYFRGWLVAKGRKYYETALADPVRAADEAEGDAEECEDMLSAAAVAYKAKTGNYPAHPKTGVTFPKEPAGKPWDEDELEELYPSLWERFT